MKDLTYDSFFATLSGNRRLEILQYLRRSGHQNVTEIASGTGIEQSAVSHSLTRLLACEFVHIKVSGKHRYYTLNEETIVPLLDIIDRHIAKYCTSKCTCCTASRSEEELKPIDSRP